MKKIQAILCASVLALAFFCCCTSPPQGGKDMPAPDAKTELLGVYKNRIRGYVIAYDSSMNPGGKVTQQRMTVYVKDEKRVRVDSVLQTANDGTTRAYMLNGILFICVPKGQGWECGKMGLVRDLSPINPEDDLKKIEQGITGGTVKRLPETTIAGMRARCYLINSSMGENVVCFSDKGAVLFYDLRKGGSYSTRKATSFRESVAEYELKMPVPPKDYSS
jgi:hypothetical protein